MTHGDSMFGGDDLRIQERFATIRDNLSSLRQMDMVAAMSNFGDEIKTQNMLN